MSSNLARTRLRLLPERGSYDSATINAIIDAALICHVAFVEAGQPFVIPMIHARMEDRLVLHGSPASRLLKHIASGKPLCISMTHVDGIVLARSVAHHSMNYRSVVLFSTGRAVTSKAEKMKALEAIVEHITPGRWQEAREPTEKELQATAVVEVTIEEASAKVRTGPPTDEEEDYSLPVWAGVLPLLSAYGEPVPDPRLSPDVPLPDYLLKDSLDSVAKNKRKP